MNIKILLFTIVLILSVKAEGQDTTLNYYISIGLQDNLALKQRESDWQQSIEVLREAKGMFYPGLSFNARYTVADGGRIIEFPVGDLLNPVYSTLNSLTGQPFPSVDNQEFPFLRPTEHETKLRVVQPILNTDIIYNKKIKSNYSCLMQVDYQTYRRELVAEIKTAYYDYLKTLEIEKVLENTMEILEENRRVNQSLFRNDKVTRDAVLRSEAEISGMKREMANVEKAKNVAVAYFNFLLNRELDAPVIREAPPEMIIPPELEEARKNALMTREELTKLDYYEEMAGNSLKMQRSGRVPDLTALVDYGFQGEEYAFTPDDDFVMASVVLSWDIFKGLQTRAKIAQSKIALEKVKVQQEETEELIMLEVINAWYELNAAAKSITASEERFKSSESAFHMVNKRYSLGQASLIEYMDARKDMTNAEIEKVISRYDYFSAWAGFEKAAGLYEFEE